MKNHYLNRFEITITPISDIMAIIPIIGPNSGTAELLLTCLLLLYYE